MGLSKWTLHHINVTPTHWSTAGGVRMPEVTTPSVWRWLVWSLRVNMLLMLRRIRGASQHWVCSLMLTGMHAAANRSRTGTNGSTAAWELNHYGQIITWSNGAVSVFVCVSKRVRVRMAGLFDMRQEEAHQALHSDSIHKQCEPLWNVSFWTFFPLTDYFAIFFRAITRITAEFSVLHSDSSFLVSFSLCVICTTQCVWAGYGQAVFHLEFTADLSGGGLESSRRVCVTTNEKSTMTCSNDSWKNIRSCSTTSLFKWPTHKQSPWSKNMLYISKILVVFLITDDVFNHCPSKIRKYLLLAYALVLVTTSIIKSLYCSILHLIGQSNFERPQSTLLFAC